MDIEKDLKKHKDTMTGDLRAEYDFSAMKGGVRGKHLRRYLASTKSEVIMEKRQKTEIGFGEVATMMGISALVGASIAKPKDYEAFKKYYITWSPYTTKYLSRSSALTNAGFRIQRHFVESNPHIKEALSCYLHGLGISALASISRALVFELQKAYENIKGIKAPGHMKFVELLDWAKSEGIFNESEQPIASDLRQLRNASEHRDMKVTQIQVMSALDSLKRLVEKIYRYKT